jgi:hypothetical protein
MIATGLLFTTLGGLGAVIMVGTIILPIMMSLGISPLAAAGVMLVGISMGGSLNISNWQLYISVLNLSRSTVRNFALVMTALYFIVGLIFCFWSLRRSQLRRFLPVPEETRHPVRRIALLSPVIPLLLVLVLDWPIVPAFIAGLMFALLAANAEGEIALISMTVFFLNLWLLSLVAPVSIKTLMTLEMPITEAILWRMAAIALFLLWVIYALVNANKKQRSTRWKLAVLTPLVTLIFIHFLKWPAVSGFFAGLLLALVITVRYETLQTFTRSVLESFESVAPAVVLIIGIGMLLNSVSHANLRNALQPFLSALSPRNGFLFVIIFSLLTPLALYRGPLNLWGMGTGFATIMLTTGVLTPEAIMAVLISVGAMQGVCDPTNTHNVWIAAHTKVDTADILKLMAVYIWPMVVVALSIAAIMYY